MPMALAISSPTSVAAHRDQRLFHVAGSTLRGSPRRSRSFSPSASKPWASAGAASAPPEAPARSSGSSDSGAVSSSGVVGVAGVREAGA